MHFVCDFLTNCISLINTQSIVVFELHRDLAGKNLRSWNSWCGKYLHVSNAHELQAHFGNEHNYITINNLFKTFMNFIEKKIFRNIRIAGDFVL